MKISYRRCDILSYCQQQVIRKFDLREGSPRRDELKKTGKGFYLRRVGLKGGITLHNKHYHVGPGRAGQKVWVLRTSEILYVYNANKELIKKLPTKDIPPPDHTESPKSS